MPLKPPQPGDRVVLPQTLGGHPGRIKWVMPGGELAVSFMYPAENGTDHRALIYMRKEDVYVETEMSDV